jgi:hypothetical protein
MLRVYSFDSCHAFSFLSHVCSCAALKKFDPVNKSWSQAKKSRPKQHESDGVTESENSEG